MSTQHNKTIVEEKKEKDIIGLQTLSIEEVVAQINLIHNVMKTIMKKDEHYGIIPNTKKPTLYKPGAEKICLTFRLAPDYEIIREIREEDFISYIVKCSLTHIISKQIIACGIGACNSKENKYNFRYIQEEGISTGKVVPKEYWEIRKDNPIKAQELLGGAGFQAKKGENGIWQIYTKGKFEKEINKNPWELDNTIIKMACKRALIAATLNATATSDIFTQDIEDFSEEFFQQPSQQLFQQPSQQPSQQLFQQPSQQPSQSQQNLQRIKDIIINLNKNDKNNEIAEFAKRYLKYVYNCNTLEELLKNPSYLDDCWNMWKTYQDLYDEKSITIDEIKNDFRKFFQEKNNNQ